MFPYTISPENLNKDVTVYNFYQKFVKLCELPPGVLIENTKVFGCGISLLTCLVLYLFRFQPDTLLPFRSGDPLNPVVLHNKP